jgi:hypothetical protein
MYRNTGGVPSLKIGRSKWLLTFLIIMLALPAAACSMPALPDIPFIQPSQPELEDLSPTPVGDTLSFFVPAYAVNLDPGETVPGTRLTYIGRSGDDYEASIDGQTALKRPGDSFYWSGVVAPGVFANYNLRLTTSLFGGLPVAGPVELIVFNPEALELPSGTEPEARLHYGNLVIDYTVPVGVAIPGTTLFFDGVESQGIGDQSSQMARIRGLQQTYPNIAVGDSLVWTGRLRDNVVVRYNLRALSFDERALHLVGTGDLWILN